MGRSSVSYIRYSASAFAFWEPGLWDRVKTKQVKNMAHLASRGFSLLAAWMYSRLRWSVQMRKGCLAPSSSRQVKWRAECTPAPRIRRHMFP